MENPTKKKMTKQEIWREIRIWTAFVLISVGGIGLAGTELADYMMNKYARYSDFKVSRDFDGLKCMIGFIIFFLGLVLHNPKSIL